jgi:hypothetical protein
VVYFLFYKSKHLFRAVRQVLIFVNPYCFVHAQLALQEEKLRLEEEALYAAQREAARAAKQRKLLEVRGKDPNVHQAAFLLIFSHKSELGLFPPRISGFYLTVNVLMHVFLGILKENQSNCWK